MRRKSRSGIWSVMAAVVLVVGTLGSAVGGLTASAASTHTSTKAVLLGAGLRAQGSSSTAVSLAPSKPRRTPNPTPTPTATLTPSATPTATATPPGDWPKYLHDTGGSGFNANETAITAASASSLAMKSGWPVHGGTISTQPVVYNNMVYWGAWDGYEYATPLGGTQASPSGYTWRYYVGRMTDTNTGYSCNPHTVGVASTPAITAVSINGTTHQVLFVGGGGNEDASGTLGNTQSKVLALDATSGSLLWSQNVGTRPSNAPANAPSTFMWSSPVTYNGSVYVGIASFGDCPLVQGQLVQLDATTGAIQHTFSVVPDTCTGGGIWSSPTVDTADGSIYVSTGNGDSCASTSSENYCTSSSAEPCGYAVIKLRASDLTYLSSWQVPGIQRVSDSDFGGAVTLFTGTDTSNVFHTMAGVTNKNGTYYAFDRGKLSNGPLWQAAVAQGGDCPQCGKGGISPSAFDGTTLYVGAGNTTINGTSYQGSLSGFNPGTGAVLWRLGLSSGPVLGAVAAVPGLAAVGAGNAMVMVNTATGAVVFQALTSTSGAIFYGAPTISHGVLYEGDTSGNLYAYQPTSSTTLFTTSFESGQPSPTWTNTVDSTGGGLLNVTGICCGLTGPETGVRSETAHTGTSALLYSGNDTSATQSYAYDKVFDLSTRGITVGPATTLSYWIYPQSSTSPVPVSGSNSTCVAMDMIFTDGSDLRDSGAVDQNGVRLHPAYQCGHLVLDTWNHVTSVIGTKVSGKTISRLNVGYDQPPNTGGYRGYIDDISLSN